MIEKNTTYSYICILFYINIHWLQFWPFEFEFWPIAFCRTGALYPSNNLQNISVHFIHKVI